MLVLSRQKNQTIMIGDLIEIAIVDIRGDKVRLGITAPVSIPVHRKEVYEAIQAENEAAANVAVDDVTMLEQIVRQPPAAPDKSALARGGLTVPPGEQTTQQAGSGPR